MRAFAALSCWLVIVCASSVAGAQVRQLPVAYPLGGRVVSASRNPGDANKLLAVSEAGGLFLSQNGGTVWSHADGLPPHRLIDGAWVDARTIVVAAQLDNYQENPTLTPPHNSSGIWRSHDSGTHFTQTLPVLCDGAPAGTWGIAVEPGTTNVYVGTDCGVFKASDGGVRWTPIAGMNARATSLVAHGGVLDVYASDGHHRYSGGRWTTAPSGRGLSDHGAPLLAIHALAVSPIESNVLFAATSNASASESDDGGNSWHKIFQSAPNGGRDGFVRPHVSNDGNAQHLDVYIGNGENLVRQTCTGSGSSTRCTACPSSAMDACGGFSQVGLGKSDVNDLLWGASGNCPLYVLSDGGLESTTDCGANFSDVPTGSGGLQALQIYQVAGQLIGTNRTDLYLALQDNGSLDSADGIHWGDNPGGDVLYFTMLRHAASETGQVVVTRGCFPDCITQSSSPLNMRTAMLWNEPGNNYCPPPFSSRICAVSVPVTVTAGEYLQIALDLDRLGIPAYKLFRRVGSNPWEMVAVLDAPPAPQSVPVVYGSGSTSGAWVLYQKTDSNGTMRVTLEQITGFNMGASSAVINDADDGVLDVDSFCLGEGTFGWPLVWSVDPNDHDHIIAADKRGSMMVRRLDASGVPQWTADTALTALLTNNGNEQFHSSTLSPHVIAFDPEVPGHILVGTEDRGLIRSTDGGNTWSVMEGSERIRAISSIFFGRDHTAYVATYGSGLWTVQVPQWQIQLPVVFPRHWIIDPSTGAVIRWPFPPDWCPACTVLLPDRGEVIRDLTVEKTGVLRAALTSNGSLHQLTLKGQLSTAPLKTLAAPPAEKARFLPGLSPQLPGVAKLAKLGGQVKGVIVDPKGQVRGLISDVGEKGAPLPLKPLTPGPSLTMIGTVALGFGNAAHGGDPVSAVGHGFCGDAKCKPVVFSFGDSPKGKVVATGKLQARPDKTGAFSAQLTAPARPGRYYITAMQETSGKPIIARAELIIGNGGERR